MSGFQSRAVSARLVRSAGARAGIAGYGCKIPYYRRAGGRSKLARAGPNYLCKVRGK